MIENLKNGKLFETWSGIVVPIKGGSSLGLLTPSGDLLSLRPHNKTKYMNHLLGESVEVIGRLQNLSRKQKALHVLHYSAGQGPPERLEDAVSA
jgi:hypothetical protein